MKYKGYEVLTIKLEQNVKLMNDPVYGDPWFIRGPLGYLNTRNEWDLLVNCTWVSADSATGFWERYKKKYR